MTLGRAHPMPIQPSDKTSPRDILVTGGTGYIGRGLIPELARRVHRVRALVRPGSERKLPSGTTAVIGNPLDAATWSASVPPADTLVHLIGTPHPSPSKARQFEEIDLASIRATVSAARAGGIRRIRHLVYVSVAHPAPIMGAFIAVRQQGEALVRASGIDATIVRPWYVLGPRHRWPYVLVPVYALLRHLPSTAATARRLGLVTLPQLIRTLVGAVENPPTGVRIVEVPEIRDA